MNNCNNYPTELTFKPQKRHRAPSSKVLTQRKRVQKLKVAPTLEVQILENLTAAASFCQINPNYLQNQPEISQSVRSGLIDWIIGACVKLKLRPETLHLAVNLLDRYMSKNRSQGTNFQCLLSPV